MSALPQRLDRSRVEHADRGPRPLTAAGRSGPPPPLRLVAPPPGRSRVVLLVGMIVVGVLIVVALQAQAAGAAFAVRDLEREVTALERRHEQLTAEVAALQAPERLRRIAMEQLDMVPAEGATYLDLAAPGRLAAATTEPVTDPVKQVRDQR